VGGMRRAWLLIFTSTMAIVVSLAVLAPGPIDLGFSVINVGLVIRLGGYVITLTCGFMLAVIALRNRYTYIALLFGLFGISHLLALISVVFTLYRVPTIYSDWLRALLTPVVAAQALTYLYIIAEWMRGDNRQPSQELTDGAGNE